MNGTTTIRTEAASRTAGSSTTVAAPKKLSDDAFLKGLNQALILAAKKNSNLDEALHNTIIFKAKAKGQVMGAELSEANIIAILDDLDEKTQNYVGKQLISIYPDSQAKINAALIQEKPQTKLQAKANQLGFGSREITPADITAVTNTLKVKKSTALNFLIKQNLLLAPSEVQKQNLNALLAAKKEITPGFYHNTSERVDFLLNGFNSETQVRLINHLLNTTECSDSEIKYLVQTKYTLLGQVSVEASFEDFLDQNVALKAIDLLIKEKTVAQEKLKDLFNTKAKLLGFTSLDSIIKTKQFDLLLGDDISLRSAFTRIASSFENKQRSDYVDYVLEKDADSKVDIAGTSRALRVFIMASPDHHTITAANQFFSTIIISDTKKRGVVDEAIKLCTAAKEKKAVKFLLQLKAYLVNPAAPLLEITDAEIDRILGLSVITPAPAAAPSTPAIAPATEEEAQETVAAPRASAAAITTSADAAEKPVAAPSAAAIAAAAETEAQKIEIRKDINLFTPVILDLLTPYVGKLPYAEELRAYAQLNNLTPEQKQERDTYEFDLAKVLIALLEPYHELNEGIIYTDRGLKQINYFAYLLAYMQPKIVEEKSLTHPSKMRKFDGGAALLKEKSAPELQKGEALVQGLLASKTEVDAKRFLAKFLGSNAKDNKNEIDYDFALAIVNYAINKLRDNESAKNLSAMLNRVKTKMPALNVNDSSKNERLIHSKGARIRDINIRNRAITKEITSLKQAKTKYKTMHRIGEALFLIPFIGFPLMFYSAHKSMQCDEQIGTLKDEETALNAEKRVLGLEIQALEEKLPASSNRNLRAALIARNKSSASAASTTPVVLHRNLAAVLIARRAKALAASTTPVVPASPTEAASSRVEFSIRSATTIGDSSVIETRNGSSPERDSSPVSSGQHSGDELETTARVVAPPDATCSLRAQTPVTDALFKHPETPEATHPHALDLSS